MGEISDALRRARLERETGPETDANPEATSEIAEALRRARLEREAAAGATRGADPVADLPPLGAHDGSEVGGVEIPRDEGEGWQARVVLVHPHGPVAERFRHLAIRVREELEHRKVRSLLVTSALRSEGKTTTACNLALALASVSGETRVALMELDLRRPSLRVGLGVHPPVGVERVLVGEAPASAARVPTNLGNLDLYLCEQRVPNAHELLSGRRLPALLDQLAGQYGAIVIDTPPVLPVPDVPLVAPHVGACMLVARAGTSRRSPFSEMLELLPREKLIGTFLNHAPSFPGRGYKRYAYEPEDEDEGRVD